MRKLEGFYREGALLETIPPHYDRIKMYQKVMVSMCRGTPPVVSRGPPSSESRIEIVQGHGNEVSDITLSCISGGMNTALHHAARPGDIRASGGGAGGFRQAASMAKQMGFDITQLDQV
jgi:hypothetical protein